MKPIHMIVLGGKKVKYLLRDLYTTDRAAGAVNNTPAEPGGTVTAANTRAVNDSLGNKLSITGGRLVSSGITGGGDPRLVYGPISRMDTPLAKWTMKWVANRSGGGWSETATPTTLPITGMTDASGQLTPSSPCQPGYAQASTGVDYTFWAQLFSATGGAVWMQEGGVSPMLLWVDDINNSTLDCYFVPILARANNCQIEIDNIEIKRGTLATPQKFATIYASHPLTGASYTSTADALHYMNFTLPASPAAGDKIELRYRVQDATNYWTAYVLRNAGNTNWDFNLDLVQAGVPTNKINVLNVSNAVIRIGVVNYSNTHVCFTGAGQAWTIRGSAVTDATFNTATGISPVYPVGDVTRLSSFKRTWTQDIMRESATPRTLGNGAVLINFDDSINNIYGGLTYLKNRGLVATVYAITDVIGDATHLSAAQLQEMDAAGFAVGNHTHTHTNLTTLTEAQQETELSTAKSDLDALGLTRASAQVAYPNGAYDANTLTAMTATGMLTGRIVGASPTYIDPKVYTITPYLIPTTSLTILTATAVTTLESYIRIAVGSNIYAILLFHQLLDVPGGEGAYSNANFQTLVDWIVANGIQTKTIIDLYNAMTA